MRRAITVLGLLLPLCTLAWNLTHLNVGLQDFFALAAFARGFVENGAWPATPYFPAGYPLLLIPGGLMGNVLIWGYCLSALGGMLALFGLARLMAELGADERYQLAGVFAAWLMPVWFIPAGSPSLDMLYTGLGVWSLAGAIHLWRNNGGEANPRWVYWSVLGAPAALTFLRYHALVLVLPVLLVLLIKYKFKLGVAWGALGFIVAVTLVNQLVPFALTGQPMPSVVPLQVRAGIEIDNAVDYPKPELIFEHYRSFAEKGRGMSLIKHYGLALIAKHSVKGWLKFLRRPTIAFALLLLVVALIFRLGVPRGALLLGLWIVLYCLALSPAYYTPRATTLPALAGAAILLAVLFHVLTAPRRLSTLFTALIVIFAAYYFSSSYCRLIFNERMQSAAISRAADHYVESVGLTARDVLTLDDRLMPLTKNPWCTPYATIGGSWVLDPAIALKQYPGLKYIQPQGPGIAPPKPTLLRQNVILARPGAQFDTLRKWTETNDFSMVEIVPGVEAAVRSDLAPAAALDAHPAGGG